MPDPDVLWNNITRDLEQAQIEARTFREVRMQLTKLINPLERAFMDLEVRAAYTANVRQAADLLGITAGNIGPDDPQRAFLLSAIDAAAKVADANVQSLVKQAINLSPLAARAEFPSLVSLKDLEDAGIDIGGGPVDRVKVATVFTGEGGKIYALMDNGDVIETGRRAPPNTKVEVDRHGDLIAFNLDDPTAPPTVIQRGFDFPQVDPRVKFQTETALAFAGLDLQRRGILVNAQIDFMAREIELGRLTYDEANTNLNRINSAFDQRRKDMEIQLQYAVSRTSLRTNAAGETVSALPLGADLAKILGVAPSNFELPVAAINPQATGEAVLAGSQFQSPIAGLQAQLEATRQAVAAIVGAPQASAMVAGTAAQAATAGMVPNG